MANRATDEQVRDIIPNTSITDLTPFINAANSVVDSVPASDCGSDLADSQLEQTEIWLSAHYAAVTDPSLALQSEKFESESNTYSRGSSSENGIKSTQYGQMANTSSNGCLVEADMRKATFFTVGGDIGSECEQL